MKSSNPSFRRLAFAAAALAAGNFAFAQSTSGTSGQNTSNSSNSSMQNSNDQSGTNSKYNSSTNTSDSSDRSMSASADASSERGSKWSSDNSGNKDKLSWGDRHFVHKAADGGQSEVALGQLAQEKASNPDVRQFGQTLVQDHTQANSQLMQIAQQKNVKIDQDDDKDRTYKRLSKMSGNDFDREFVDHEVEDHEKDIKMFEKEAKNAKDSDLRQFASSALPKLRDHLATAQRLQRSIVPTGNDANSGYNSSNSSGSATSNSNSSLDNSANASSTNASGSGSSMSGSNPSGTTAAPGSSGATSSSSSTTK